MSLHLCVIYGLNNLKVAGLSLRESYQQIGSQVQSGNYRPDMSKKHTHLRSIDKLCPDKINQKFP